MPKQWSRRHAQCADRRLEEVCRRRGGVESETPEGAAGNRTHHPNAAFADQQQLVRRPPAQRLCRPMVRAREGRVRFDACCVPWWCECCFGRRWGGALNHTPRDELAVFLACRTARSSDGNPPPPFTTPRKGIQWTRVYSCPAGWMAS